MLVIIDPQLGAEAHRAAAHLAARLGRQCAVFVAPADEPDAGLRSAMAAARTAVVESETPPGWLAALDAVRVRFTDDAEALVGAVAGATGMAPRVGGGHAAKLPPLDSEALTAALARLHNRWTIEVITAPRLPHGLKAELVAEIACPNHLVGADLVRAIADIAEAQDHHPTLAQAYHTVTVRVTTGEAAGRLTERDIAFAEAVDRAVADAGIQ